MEVAAHNEFSRILAEHGVFGIFALFILVGFPIQYFFQNNIIGERVIIIALIGFCFVFMTHAATRIQAPMFFYMGSPLSEYLKKNGNLKFMILYLGNKLSKHGKAASVIELLTPKLGELSEIISFSERRINSCVWLKCYGQLFRCGTNNARTY
ncbi:MAG: hypothetical protein U5K54_17635 [Cytophagales bacterium]|nr:hypothetical protein [Cytophagales bacterium]